MRTQGGDSSADPSLDGAGEAERVALAHHGLAELSARDACGLSGGVLPRGPAKKLAHQGAESSCSLLLTWKTCGVPAFFLSAVVFDLSDDPGIMLGHQVTIRSYSSILGISII